MAVTVEPDGTTVLTLKVNPIPQPRARVALRTDELGHVHGRGFSPPQLAVFYEEVRWALKAAGVRTPLTGNLAVWLTFRRACWSDSQRGDLSNLVKAFEDAANGHLWVDDRQICELHAYLDSWGRNIAGQIDIRVRQLTGTPA